MEHNRSGRRWPAAVAALATLVVSVLVALPAAASHLRGALGEATYDPQARTVTLRTTLLQRKGFGSYTFFTFPTITRVDRTTGATTAVTRCAGQSTAGQLTTDTTSQPLFDIDTSVYVVDVSCVAFNPNFDYVFAQTGNNRIAGIRNTTNLTIQVETRVRIDGVHASSVPIFHAGYMTNVPYDPTATFTTNMNAVAGDGTAVTYALVTNQSSALGGYGAARIPCSSFNTTTGSFSIGAALCTGTETYAAAFGGGTDLAPVFYALKVKATDASGQYMTRDVLLAFASSTNTKPTITSGSPSRLVLVPGTTTTISIVATDADAADHLDFASDGLPLWATLTRPPSPTNPATATLTLHPPAQATETAQITVSAYDDAAYPLSASLQFDVQVGGAVLPPAAPVVTGVTPADGSATVAFTAAAGGGEVASFTAVLTAPDGTTVTASCAAPPTPCTVSGLQNGTTYTVVVRAANAMGAADSAPATVVPNGPMPPALTANPSALTLLQNVARATNVLGVTNTGGAVVSWNLSPAPPTGLTFSTVTGSLTGTPTVLQSAQRYTLTATNALGSSSVSVDIAVASGTQTITFAQPWGMKVSSSNLVQNLVATSTSGLTVSFAVASGSTAGCTVSGTQVRVATNAQTGTCTIVATQAGGSGYAAAAPVYRSFYVFSSSSTSTSCASATSTRTYSHAALLVVSPTAATLTVGTNTATTPFAIVNAGAPGASFSAGGVPTACPISTASSGGYKISSSLPAGLSLNANTGAITGTPTSKQSATTYQLWAVTKKSSGSLTSATVALSIEIQGKPQSITFASLADKALGSPAFTVFASASSGLTVTFQSVSPSVCTVSGSTVSLVGAGTCSLTAAQSGSSSWAVANTVTRSFAVLSKPVLRLSTSSGSFTANTPVGTPYTITNTGSPAVTYAISPEPPDGTKFDVTTGLLAGAPEEGQDATAYAITATNSVGTSNPVTFTITVARAAQTLTFDRLHGMVVGDVQTASATADSGLPATLTVSTPAVCHLSGTALHADAVGTCTVVAHQAGDPTYLAATDVTRSVVVSATLTRPELTIDNTTATFPVGLPIFAPYEVVNVGGAATSYAISPALPVGFTFDPTTGAIADGTASVAGTTAYTITATNAVGTSAPVTFTLEIVKRAQTIAFPALTRMFLSSPDQLLRATADSGLPVAYTVAAGSTGVCSVVAGRVRSLAGGTCTIEASQAGDATFAPTSASASFTVLVPPAPSVTPSTVVLTAGAAVTSAYTIVNTGGDATFWSIAPPLPDGVSLDSATGAIVGMPTATAAAQTYTLTGANDAGAGPSTTFSLRVDKHAQVVTFAALNGAVLTQAATLDQQLVAVADSGLPVSFAVAAGSTSVCSVTGDVVTALAAGTCTVTASQAGDTTWATATTASRSFTVYATLVAPNISVAPTAGTMVFDGDAGTPFSVANAGGPAASYSISPALPAGLSFDTTTAEVTGTPTTTSAATTYTITATNASGSSSATYRLTIAKATAAVTLTGLQATYTGSSISVGATTDPAGLTVQLTYDGSYSAPTAAGTYTVVATVNDANYSGSVTGTLVIGRATATVTLADLARTWTGSPLAPTVTTAPSGLTVDVTYDGTAGAPDRAGSYSVVATVDDLNHEGVATGTFVVTALAPDAPVITAVDPGDGEVHVSFTTGSDGGAPLDAIEYRLDSGAWVDAGTSASPITIGGLTNGVAYVVQLRAVNSAGGGPASVGYVGRPFGRPTAVSALPDAVTTTTARLHGDVTANGAVTTVQFAWGLTPGLPTDEHLVDAEQSPLAADGGATAVAATVTGLPEGTTVYVRLLATNAAGTVSGVVVSFTTDVTPPPPSTTTTTEPPTTSTSTTTTVPPTTSTSTTEPPTTSTSTTTTEPPTTTSSSTTTVAVTTTTTTAPPGTTTTAAGTTTTAAGTTTSAATTTSTTVAPSSTTTVAPTTTSTAAPAPVPAPQPKQDGALPELPPGAGVVLDASGVPQTVNVTVNGGTVGLDAGSFGMTLSSGTPPPAGQPVDTGGVITLEAGKTARVTGYGFEPASRVDVWLFSDPRYVGQTTVLADGTFDVTLPVPADVDPGDHTLQANGHTDGGVVRSMNAGVKVADAADLPTTGAHIDRTVRSAVGLVLVGIALVLVGRRARRRSRATA